MKEKSISSRVTPNTFMEIQFLKRELGINQTEIVQNAIHLLYQTTKTEKPKLTRYELFEQSGFLGAIEAEKDLSETYKQKLDVYLKKKYAQ